jgi:hypothetical protein
MKSMPLLPPSGRSTQPLFIAGIDGFRVEEYVMFIIASYPIAIPNITIRNTGKGNTIAKTSQHKRLVQG